MHERLSGLFGKGARAEGAADTGRATDADTRDDEPFPSAADLERRARELEQRAVDIDEALRQATADLTAARRGSGASQGHDQTHRGGALGTQDRATGEHRRNGSHPAAADAGNPVDRAERIRDLEAVVARLHEEADACHTSALAARLRADDAAGRGSGDEDGAGGRAAAMPIVRWNQPGVAWTDLLAAAIDEPSGGPAETDAPNRPPADAAGHGPGADDQPAGERDHAAGGRSSGPDPDDPAR